MSHRWFGSDFKRSKTSCVHVLLPDTCSINSSLGVLESTPGSQSVKPMITRISHSPEFSGISVRRSKLSRAEISLQWFLPQVCWRLQIKGTEKHFRKLKFFTSHAWMRVSLFLFHWCSCSIQKVQKFQCTSKQKSSQYLSIALPGKLILRQMNEDGLVHHLRLNIHSGMWKGRVLVTCLCYQCKAFPSECNNPPHCTLSNPVHSKSVLKSTELFSLLFWRLMEETEDFMVSLYFLLWQILFPI